MNPFKGHNYTLRVVVFRTTSLRAHSATRSSPSTSKFQTSILGVSWSHAFLELPDAIEARHRLTTISPQRLWEFAGFPSRRLYDVCRGWGDDCRETGDVGRTRSFSRWQRLTRHWEQRILKVGTMGPGSRPSFMTTRDLRLSVAKWDADASNTG